MKKTVPIAIGVLILIVLISSFSYQLGKKAGLTIGAELGGVVSPATSLVKSKVIQSQWASARGKITEIKDRTLTLAAAGDSLAIPIKENAELITLVTGEEGTLEPKTIEFKDIQVGDEVTVQIEVLAGGQLAGGNVTLLPAPSQ